MSSPKAIPRKQRVRARGSTPKVTTRLGTVPVIVWHTSENKPLRESAQQRVAQTGFGADIGANKLLARSVATVTAAVRAHFAQQLADLADAPLATDQAPEPRAHSSGSSARSRSQDAACPAVPQRMGPASVPSRTTQALAAELQNAAGSATQAQQVAQHASQQMAPLQQRQGPGQQPALQQLPPQRQQPQQHSLQMQSQQQQVAAQPPVRSLSAVVLATQTLHQPRVGAVGHSVSTPAASSAARQPLPPRSVANSGSQAVMMQPNRANRTSEPFQHSANSRVVALAQSQLCFPARALAQAQAPQHSAPEATSLLPTQSPRARPRPSAQAARPCAEVHACTPQPSQNRHGSQATRARASQSQGSWQGTATTQPCPDSPAAASLPESLRRAGSVRGGASRRTTSEPPAAAYYHTAGHTQSAHMPCAMMLQPRPALQRSCSVGKMQVAAIRHVWQAPVTPAAVVPAAVPGSHCAVVPGKAWQQSAAQKPGGSVGRCSMPRHTAAPSQRPTAPRAQPVCVNTDPQATQGAQFCVHARSAPEQSRHRVCHHPTHAIPRALPHCDGRAQRCALKPLALQQSHAQQMSWQPNATPQSMPVARMLPHG